jgi:hypothetical protein
MQGLIDRFAETGIDGVVVFGLDDPIHNRPQKAGNHKRQPPKPLGKIDGIIEEIGAEVICRHRFTNSRLFGFGRLAVLDGIDRLVAAGTGHRLTGLLRRDIERILAVTTTNDHTRLIP